MINTIDKHLLMIIGEKCLLPTYDPMVPPTTAEIAIGNAKKGNCFVPEIFPRRPAMEFTKMKPAETADAVFVRDHFIKTNSGVKNIPPPTPVTPERKPRPAPTDRATAFCG